MRHVIGHSPDGDAVFGSHIHAVPGPDAESLLELRELGGDHVDAQMAQGMIIP